MKREATPCYPSGKYAINPLKEPIFRVLFVTYISDIV